MTGPALDPGTAGSWAVITYAGHHPEWVVRLAEAVRRHMKGPGGIVESPAGPGGQPSKSKCAAAWAYDGLRKRKAKSIRTGVAASVVPLPHHLAFCVSLVDNTPPESPDHLLLRAGGRPAAELQQALEEAMILGRGEIEITAAWRRSAASGSTTWRCSLVDMSIAMSMDLAAEKLLGLVTHWLSCPEAFTVDSGLVGRPGLHSSRQGVLTRSLQNAKRQLTATNQWAIRIYENVGQDVLWPEGSGIDLIPPPDRFWADPFPVRDGKRLWVFFEELIYATPKGTICCVAIDEGRVGKPFAVLEEPCHLSYPNVFQHQGNWYMLPESSERHDLVLYKATRFPDQWEPVVQLLSNVRIVDATLHQDSLGWWLFAGSADAPGGAFDDNLHMYRAPDLLGPWNASAFNPVRVDPSSSRPAGPLFQMNGHWIRPVQDCRGRYGRALHLLGLEGIDVHGPRERLIATLAGDEASGTECVHTYARVGTDLAVDWQQWRPKIGSAKNLRRPIFRCSRPPDV